MSKKTLTSYRNVIAWVTGSLMVLQVLLPGGFNVQEVEAATNNWGFDLAADYTTSGMITVSGGYAVTDLAYTDATDSLDGYGATTDLVELGSGRVVAAVATAGSFPYSDDSGATWTVGAVCGPIDNHVNTKLAYSAGRVIAAGYLPGDTGAMRYSVDGICWSNATVPANVTRFTSVAEVNGLLYAGSGGGVQVNDGKIFVSMDGGLNWSKTLADPTNLTEIQDITGYGGRLFVAGTRTAGHDTLSAIYYSDNLGSSWTELSANAGNTHSIVYSLAVSNNGLLYATTNQDYVLRSGAEANGAFTFTRVSATDAANARAIHITALGDIFVPISGGRMLRSVNGGSVFFQATLGVAGPLVTYSMIRLTKTTNFFLLAVSDGGGGTAYRGYFATAAKSLTNNTGVAYNSISEFIETPGTRSESTGTYYRISKTANIGPWVYWDGDSWETSDNTTKVTAASTIHANLDSFNAQVGTGTFYFYATMDPIPVGGTANPSLIIDTVSITYDEASLTLTSPNGGEQWRRGSTQNITWTDVALGGGDLIDISYSLNNGDDWATVVTGTANDGAHPWTVPNQTTTAALVRITSGLIEDESNAVFTILGGTPPPGDTTAPISEVDDLSQYQTSATFPVSVTAQDNYGGVGIAEVFLFYTYGEPADNINDLLKFGTSKSGCPTECFTWDFDAPLGDGHYYFYSSARDSAMPPNDNLKTKFVSSITVEAETIVDSQAPYVEYSSPTQGQNEVAAAGNILVNLSEEMNHDISLLDYNLYKMVNGQKIAAKDKLGTPDWSRQGGGQPIYDEILIPYTNLDRGVTYTFTIRSLQDLAGNNIQKNSFEPPESTPVWMLNFTTAPILDPDLTRSKIEITNLPAGGKFSPGNRAHFKVTLENDSNTTASQVTATLNIASGLTYCTDILKGCAAAIASYNPQPIITQNGNQITLTWGPGIIVKGTPLTINFDTTVNNPAMLLATVQSMVVNDGVHPSFNRSVTLNIQKNPNFSTSTKTGVCIWQIEDDEGNPRYEERTCTDAVLGTQITYIITATNSGNTPADVEMTDAIPSGLEFGMITQADGWDEASYNSETRVLTALATLLPGQSKVVKFIATVNMQGQQDLYITNTAVIKDSDPALADRSETVTFTTKVPGISVPDDFPLQIVSQSPSTNKFGVSPTAKIEVGFSKSVNLSTFDYIVKIDGELVDISNWDANWSIKEGGDLPNTYLTLVPDDTLELGQTYTVEIDGNDSDGDTISVKDTDGNALVASDYPNPWSFTVVDPVVRITKPEGIVEVGVNFISPAFTVEIQDQHSKTPYKVEEDISIGVYGEIPATGKPGFFREISDTALFGATTDESRFVPSTGRDLFHIQVPKGQSQATFYFKETVANTVTLIAFPDPYRGWSRGEKTVVVTEDTNQGQERLIVHGPTSVEVNKLSGALMVSAKNGQGATMLLPNTLYFYTESTTGTFYDSSFRPLPKMIRVSAVNDKGNLQFASNLIGEAATFYYKDIEAQSSMLIISDNSPLIPDTQLNNANFLINIFDPLPKEKEILEELEEVEDETGRELMELVITPDQATLLPGSAKSFTTIGYDQDGQEIENLKVKWYVVAGGGEIVKDGIEGNNHQSIFTAGNKTGTYYDTVLVGTIYNKKFAFATATIKIADVVTYRGPARLPTTGFSSLQFIFMGLTLCAAVALAWVEHYEKTYFKHD